MSCRTLIWAFALGFVVAYLVLAYAVYLLLKGLFG